MAISAAGIACLVGGGGDPGEAASVAERKVVVSAADSVKSAGIAAAVVSGCRDVETSPLHSAV